MDFESYQRHICPTYSRLPVTFVRGDGCFLYDENGKEYLDFVAGIAVCNLGHCPQELADTLCEQARILVHVSNLFYTKPQIELASELCRLSFADRVFFANSGAEANEAALKLARKYSYDHFGPGRFHIIAMKGSFHGRTLAALSATGQEKLHEGFEPLVEGFSYVEFGSVTSVEQAITDRTCAVLVEPIQGEGGVRVPPDGYLKQLKDLCTKHNLLLIFDEVQVGMGRTGKLFAYEHEDCKPDIMTLAKALGNGLPIGAMLTTEQVAQSFGPGTHASTFGGSPLVTRVAYRVLELVSRPDFLARVREIGNYFMEKLRELRARHLHIRDVRGRGLIIGMELTFPGKELVTRCLEKGLVINCVQDSVLRFTPPLVVKREHVDRLVETLDELLQEYDRRSS